MPCPISVGWISGLELSIAAVSLFAYARVRWLPRTIKVAALSQLLQTEHPGARIAHTPPGGSEEPRLWQIGLLAGLLLWSYLPLLIHLVGQWWKDPNFSHGFFVPLFSAFVVWQGRGKLARIAPRPSWWGLLFLGFGLGVLVLGQMGAELFLSRFSLLIVLAGLIVLFLGWDFFRALLFPWAFLILMIPLPAIVFNQITFPLQLLASKVATAVLQWLGVPVLREGNIINLPAMPLEVAEACSGIRSLMSLATLALIYGYLMERNNTVRTVLALASLPIAVAVNSMRVVVTGLLVQYWDPDKAQGFFHEFQGWLMFVASLAILYLLHRTIRLIWPEQASQSSSYPADAKQSCYLVTKRSRGLRFGLAASLIALTAILLQARGHTEVFPSRLPFSSFPAQLGGWQGKDVPLDKETLQVLGPGDFLLRGYQDANNDELPYVELFIAYFASQRTGDTIHSPQHCLPGAGWVPVENSQITLSFPGHSPFPANRYVISKAGVRKLVLYWYWAHDRGVASEYWAKFYLIKDAILVNRSDGALIRIDANMLPGETPDAAQQRIFPFASAIFPLLDSYIPR
ncbi:MAG: VPLPA-CTERM-specific exosortase XrtD [Candidatus Sulfotelmatobacter sp.]